MATPDEDKKYLDIYKAKLALKEECDEAFLAKVASLLDNDGVSVASGIYFVSVVAGRDFFSEKIIYVKLLLGGSRLEIS